MAKLETPTVYREGNRNITDAQLIAQFSPITTEATLHQLSLEAQNTDNIRKKELEDRRGNPTTNTI